jgi:hypothetical protein
MMPLVDIMYYFQKIQDLNPKVVMVPLAKNDFNAAISNIAWIEATLAGAVTISLNYVPSFRIDGIVSRAAEYFEVGLMETICEDDSHLHEASVSYIEDNLKLSVVNEKRYEIVEP